MTAPRTGLFQRKPMPSMAAGMAMPQTSNSAGPGMNDQDGDEGAAASPDPSMVTCPECGCQFDPSKPDSYQPAGTGQPMGGSAAPGGSGSDLGATIAAMMQGKK